jgi:hypothetical protein
MNLKGVLLFISALIILFLIVFYFFIPLNTTELDFSKNTNSNFTLDNSSGHMQFYENMRFPSPRISYRIDGCPLNKKGEMEEAFVIMENLTVLEFYPVIMGEEITINCDDKAQFEGNLFIAGEGGPTNITVAGDYNIITAGKILLLRESQCSRPNIALHELLHVLGFDHSMNSDNIMYEITKCSQTIGDDILDFINKIYSVPPNPDLIIEDVSGFMSGKYLNVNLTIRNQGMISSGIGKIVIYADDKKIKEIEVDSLEVGYGTKLSLSNIWINKISLDEIKFVVETDFKELSKSNNEVILSLKK